MQSNLIRHFTLTLLVYLGVMAVARAEEPTIQDCPECPVMVVIQAGKFMMGTSDDPLASPVHQVTFKRRFALARTEVTAAQFDFFLKRTGYQLGYSQTVRAPSAQLPVLDIDWHAVTAYVRWLSRHTGQRYRLPSEAEWEYAARAGKATRYWWGSSPVEACGKESLSQTFFPFDQPCVTASLQEVGEVARLVANPWGLFDMQGNAGEWMADRPPTGADYAQAPADGSAHIDQNSQLYVVRGPSFLDNAAPRRLVDPTERSDNTGFRVAREVP